MGVSVLGLDQHPLRKISSQFSSVIHVVNGNTQPYSVIPQYCQRVHRFVLDSQSQPFSVVERDCLELMDAIAYAVELLYREFVSCGDDLVFADVMDIVSAGVKRAERVLREVPIDPHPLKSFLAFSSR